LAGDHGPVGVLVAGIYHWDKSLISGVDLDIGNAYGHHLSSILEKGLAVGC
jgi:hypothetical protein